MPDITNSPKKPMRYVVGQELFWEASDAFSRRKGNTTKMVTIAKVGRQWLALSDGHRIDAVTLLADGGDYSSPGRCFLSREDWDAHNANKNRFDAWIDLRVKMPNCVPENVSAEDIAKARHLLGLQPFNPSN